MTKTGLSLSTGKPSDKMRLTKLGWCSHRSVKLNTRRDSRKLKVENEWKMRRWRLKRLWSLMMSWSKYLENREESK